MTNDATHADLWVIHDNQAILFREQNRTVTEQMSMPFDAFVGSATALASFSLPDTQVYLNVGATETTTELHMDCCWVGLASSPMRVICVEPEQSHWQALDALKSMGKKPQLVSASDPRHFQQATVVARLNPQELKHLKASVKQAKAGAGKYGTAFALALRLWLRPHSSYQNLRWALAAGVALCAIALQWSFQQKITELDKTSGSRPIRHMKADNSPARPVQFSAWAEQMQKFGQDNRANLQALSVQWSEQGHVYSRVQLDRERKRLPKGCTSIDANQASCISSMEQQ